MPWIWDPDARQYRESDSGRTLSERELRTLREQFLRQITDTTLTLTGRLANREITVQEWEIEMRRIVKESFGSAYMLSRGGRNAMQSEDWGRVGGLVGRQYRYLNEYAQQIAAESVTRNRALSRGQLYVQAATQSYNRGPPGHLRRYAASGAGARRRLHGLHHQLPLRVADRRDRQGLGRVLARSRRRTRMLRLSRSCHQLGTVAAGTSNHYFSRGGLST